MLEILGPTPRKCLTFPIKTSLLFTSPHGAIPMLTTFVFAVVMTGSNAEDTYLTTPSSNPEVMIHAEVDFAALIRPFRKSLASLGSRLKIDMRWKK